jgi:hypothetical protein
LALFSMLFEKDGLCLILSKNPLYELPDSNCSQPTSLGSTRAGIFIADIPRLRDLGFSRNDFVPSVVRSATGSQSCSAPGSFCGNRVALRLYAYYRGILRKE